MVPWSGARTKVQIKLAIQRLRTLQEKKLAMAKKSRREIADLLLKDRVETARLRVEGLIGDDIYVELLELLELYSEKLQARFNLLDLSSGTEPEPSIADAICAIVYAAPRTELKELQVLREMLMQKYGRAFALTLQPSDPPPESVPARVSSKLALYTPARELVDAYLYEIAKGYGVNWQPEPEDDEAKPSGEVPTPVEGDGRDSDDDSEGGPGVAEKADKKEAISVPELAEAKKGDNLGEENKAKQSETPAQPVQAKKLPPEEELAQRFDRLKKL